MNKYTAVYHMPNSKFVGRITSVGADSFHEAIAELTRQLQKPGREFIYDQWVRNGSAVIENDISEIIIKGETV